MGVGEGQVHGCIWKLLILKFRLFFLSFFCFSFACFFSSGLVFCHPGSMLSKWGCILQYISNTFLHFYRFLISFKAIKGKNVVFGQEGGQVVVIYMNHLLAFHSSVCNVSFVPQN